MSFPQSRRNECSVDGRPVHLSPMQAKLLEHLLLSPPDRFVTREELVDLLWPHPDELPLEYARCIFVYVALLRHKGVAIDRDIRIGWRIDAADRGRIEPLAVAA